MNIHNREQEKETYAKTHKSNFFAKWLFGTSKFILDDPKAFNILTLMSYILPMIVFPLFTALFFFKQMWVLFIIMLFFSIFSVKRLYQYYKLAKHFGVRGVLEGFTVREFAKKDKKKEEVKVDEKEIKSE